MRNKIEYNYSLLSKYRSEIMGIAALCIIVFHSKSALNNQINNQSFLFFIGQLNIGVEFFLIVSGIGLYFSLSKDNFSFKQYYLKRVLNVYLIYLLISFPLVLFNCIAFNGSVFDFFTDWTGLGFFLGKRYVFGNHGGWYVMFIMIMYLFYPIIFRIQKFLEKKRIDLIVLIAFVIIYILLCYYVSLRYNVLFNKYEVAITRIPIFIIGSYIGKLVYNKNRFGIGTKIIVIVGVVLYILLESYDFSFVLGRFNKMLLSVSLCLFYVILRSIIKIERIYKFFSFVGSMSLELYLTHNLANEFLFRKGHCNNIIEYVIIVAISFVISFYISKFRHRITSK